MDYREFNIETWSLLDLSGDKMLGYKTIWLSKNINESSTLNLFRDENGNYHFAIELLSDWSEKLIEPDLNGLTIEINKFRLDRNNFKEFIDVKCNLDIFLDEFTKIVSDITNEILEFNTNPVEAVNHIILNWRAFWCNRNRNLLSEEQQIGLICELEILKLICEINPSYALSTWIGPLGQRHDFNFTDWAIEVKGTRREKHCHTINGIEQLKKPEGKMLAFVSFIVVPSVNPNSISLQDCIESIRKNTFQGNGHNIVRFNELLVKAGYNALFSAEYKKFKIEVLEARIFNVDSTFPSLTSEKLIAPLDIRISDVRYDISINGSEGSDFRKINIGDYFY